MEMEVRSQKSEVRSQKSEILSSVLGLLLAFCCLLLTILPGCGQKAEEDGIRKALPKEGDVAAPFSLKLLDGKKFGLEDMKGRPVAVNFFASWCRPCRTEAPVLQRVYETYKDKGMVFIGIAIEDKEAKVAAYVKEFGITFPIGIDATGNIAEAYKIYGIPKTFIMDKHGRFSYIRMGEITEADLIKEIEKVVK